MGEGGGSLVGVFAGGVFGVSVGVGVSADCAGVSVASKDTFCLYTNRHTSDRLPASLPLSLITTTDQSIVVLSSLKKLPYRPKRTGRLVPWEKRVKVWTG